MSDAPDRTGNGFNAFVVSELNYIRVRVDSIYDKHYRLYAKVLGISAVVSALVAGGLKLW